MLTSLSASFEKQSLLESDQKLTRFGSKPAPDFYSLRKICLQKT